MPYIGPSRVPLPSVFELVTAGAWAPGGGQSRDTDMSDADIARLL